MLKIGEFSKLAQVSVKTLRYYDELGLLRPAWVDRFTGYRYYTLQQLPRLNRILALRELGFPLVQVEQLLRENLPAGELERLTRLRLVELEHQVQAAQSKLEMVAVRLRQIEQEGRQPRYEMLVKPVPSMLVAGIRDTVAGPRDVAELFGELRSYLAGRRLSADPISPCLAIYYDAEYLDRGTEVEVASPLGQRIRGDARVTVHELPGSPHVASVVHQGRYDRIPAAYGALIASVHAGGYRAAGPNREIYLQGYAPETDPGNYVTELQIPVQPVSARQREEKPVEPRIVNKPAFTIVGLPFTGTISHAPYEEGKTNNEIGALWDVMNARAGEVRHVAGPGVGLCFGMPDAHEPWYIAGFEVEQVESVPDGMMSMTVPAQKYAVFPCTLGTIGATYRYITEEWQPQSGFERAHAPDFEYYDEEFDPADPQHSRLSIYWPIE